MVWAVWLQEFILTNYKIPFKKFLFFWVLIFFRYLTCSRRCYGCFATGQMQIEEGSTILLSRHFHNHEPQPRHDEDVRMFFNRIRERGTLENIPPQIIYNEDAQQYDINLDFKKIYKHR